MRLFYWLSNMIGSAPSGMVVAAPRLTLVPFRSAVLSKCEGKFYGVVWQTPWLQL